MRLPTDGRQWHRKSKTYVFAEGEGNERHDSKAFVKTTPVDASPGRPSQSRIMSVFETASLYTGEEGKLHRG